MDTSNTIVKLLFIIEQAKNSQRNLMSVLEDYNQKVFEKNNAEQVLEARRKEKLEAEKNLFLVRVRYIDELKKLNTIDSSTLKGLLAWNKQKIIATKCYLVYKNAQSKFDEKSLEVSRWANGLAELEEYFQTVSPIDLLTRYDAEVKAETQAKLAIKDILGHEVSSMDDFDTITAALQTVTSSTANKNSSEDESEA